MDKCKGASRRLNVNNFDRIPCPDCGKMVKPRYATGGRFSEHPNYFYAPSHKPKGKGEQA